MRRKTTEEKNISKVSASKLSFSSVPLFTHKTPDFVNSTSGNFILNGANNDYPDYLTYLYNRCSLHAAIINGKTRFVLGRGWQMKEGIVNAKLESFIKSANSNDSLDEVTKRAYLDKKIFGGFYIKIVWLNNTFGAVFHLPYEKVRKGINGEFFVSDKWTKNQTTEKVFRSNKNQLPQDYKEYPAFNTANKTGVQIAEFYEYRPQMTGYPLPEYRGTIVDIESDIEISNGNLNNIKTGFSAGTMITFFNGQPTPEEKLAYESQLKNKLCGTDNAGELVLGFAGLNEKSPEISTIRPVDYDAQFANLRTDIQDRIIRGHEVVNGMLFGIKTEGQLGAKSELDLAWRLLNLNYIEPQQDQLASDFNWLFMEGGIGSGLEIKPLKGIGLDISESMLSNNLSREELRKVIEDELNIGLDLGVQTLAKTKVQTKLKMEFEQILLSKFVTIGLSAEHFEFAKDDDTLLKYLIDNKIKEINIDALEKVKELKGIDVEDALNKLQKKNLIGGNWGGTQGKPIFEIKEIIEPEILVEFETRWIYSGPKDDKNRDFCAELLKLNKYYTRDEIDLLNNDMKEFNLDVWKYKGGWYHDTTLDANLPQCRHWWQSKIMRKK